MTDADLRILEAAVAREPANLRARFALAAGLKALGRLAEAARQYEAVITADPSIAVAHNNLGNIYKDLLRHGEAEQCFLRAISLDPGLALAVQNLGGVYTEQGRSADAIAMYRRAIRVSPGYARAHHYLAFTKRHEYVDDEVRAMEILYRNPAASSGDRCHLAFGLGKAYADLRDYPRSFSYFADGNRLKREIDRYPLAQALEVMDALRSMPLAADFGRSSTDDPGDVTPIFLVGMPRSGTSLTAQVLARHSMVFGAGELPTIRELVTSAVGNFPRDLAQVDRGEWRRRGRMYLDHVRTLSNGSAFVVDKMPGNFLFAGIIRQMLPQAKIIHCRRDPLDTCVSCFKTWFNDASHGYTNDLSDLGIYYLRYLALMARWHELLPGQIFDTHYENLVENPEKSISRLLAACGLPFEVGLARFRGSQRVVATASAIQVRQPIHRRSVNSWRRHERELQPLIALLGEHSRCQSL